MQRLFKILLSVFLFFLLILGFTLPLNPPAGFWYQQFMPIPTGGQIRDLFFVDSLLGFAVSDSCILKTTNGGNNWLIKLQGYYFLERIKFLNASTGFVCGGNNQLMKSINSGENWNNIILPDIYPDDMSVIDENNIWLVNRGGLAGGVFYTSNGGASWTRQLDLGPLNPERIYMHNSRIGFITRDAANASYTRRTVDGGQNWTVLMSGTAEFFYDMYFADSLTGWGAFYNVWKTTNGGLNWIVQTIPSGGNIASSAIYEFSKISRDTIFAVGGLYVTPNGFRGIIFRTIDGGNNWLFQVPDTAIHIGRYSIVEFINNRIGWAYSTVPTGIHTTTGGDPIWLLGIKQISSEIPKGFKLYQNYPNPFNPKTVISYQIKSTVKSEKSKVKLIVFDVTGREIIKLVNEEQSPGTYEVDFSGQDYSSGVYFYQFIVDDKRIDTKKMLLIK